MSRFDPVPAGAWPAGQAWYPMLGQWGPAGNLWPDDWDPSWEKEIEPLADDLWRTKDGKVIKISDLETRHLRNIIRLIERTNGGRGCLAKLQEKSPRLRNLLDEWLARF